MSLNKDQLKIDLGNLYDTTQNQYDSAADAKADFVDRLATIIHDYIKTATINYESGLTAGSNAVAGTFEGFLS